MSPPPAQVALPMNALTLLRSLEGLTRLYHDLGYSADPDPAVFAPEEIGLEGTAAQDTLDAALLVDHEDPDGTLLQHWHFRLRGRRSTLAVRRVTENFLKRSGHYLLSFTDEEGGFSSVLFVKPRQEFQNGGQGEDGANARSLVRLSKLTVTPSRPTAHDLSVLRAVAVTPQTSAAEAHARQVDAFNVERVTRRFFETYRRLFRHVRDVIRTENPGARIGPYERSTTHDDPTLHAFTQRLLGRLLFLYFIQKKGWLDGQGDYITRLYEDATATPGGNFYRDALEPLYFGTLNTPLPRAGGLSGELPYLNGSLFEREYPDSTVLNLPNRLFDPQWAGDGAADPGGILHVLNHFNFTVGESAALEQDISLDPEMLGKVFENLMEEEEAAQSGTFYTPRSIVQFMAEETLTRYLADQTGIPQARLLPLVADNSEIYDLTLSEARAIIAALKEVRVLDPAVGTASMLVGFLNAMIRVRRSAESREAQTPYPDSSPKIAQWKREYIQHCLYGVDIKQEAIEIARLRLWLSLVVDAQEAEPLPNLDYKLMAGDGLLETVDGTAFTAIKERQDLFNASNSVNEATHQIEQRKEEFYETQDPQRRRELRGKIQELEREVFRGYVDHQIDLLQRQMNELTKEINKATATMRLESSSDKASAKKAEAQRKRAEKKYLEKGELMARYAEQKVKVWDEKEPLPFFLHNVHFAEVMKDDNRAGNGGFNIVIGNPPYVSFSNMRSDYKEALRKAFPTVAAGRADLYVYFYGKGLDLLSKGGYLCYITPNKFMRSVYGKGLRKYLSNSRDLISVYNFGDLPVFDAEAYPSIVTVKNAPPSGNNVEFITKSSLESYLSNSSDLTAVREGLSSFHLYARHISSQMELSMFSDDNWPLDNLKEMELMNRLCVKNKSLMDFVQGRVFRGIITGHNDAFLIDRIEIQETS